VVSQNSRDLLDGSDLDIFLDAPWNELTDSSGYGFGSTYSPAIKLRRTPQSVLENVAQLSLVHALRAQKGVRIFLSPPAPLRGYRLRVRSIAYSEDIEGDKKKGQFPKELGTVISVAVPAMSAAAAGIAGPVGSLITGFDFLTSIPVSAESWEKKGLVHFEISAQESRSGSVLFSRSVTGQFNSRYRKVGEELTLMNGVHEFARSVPSDAVNAAIESVAAELIDRLRKHQRATTVAH